MEDIREIPDGWEVGVISDLAEINPKKNTKKLSKDDLVSFIRMEDTSEQSKIINMSDKLLSEVEKGYTSFHDNDILFAKITPCLENGKGGLAANLTNGIGFGSTEFHVLRPKKNCSIQILYQYSKHNKLRKKAASLMIGSAGQQRIQKDFFESYTIGIPTDSEQIKIGKILDIIDQNIEKTEQTIEKYIKIKNGLMDDLLTGKRRIKYGKWVEETEFKEVDGVGNVPKDWQVQDLGKYTCIEGGYAFSSSDYCNDGIQLLKIGNVFGNELCLERDQTYLPLNFTTTYFKFIVRNDDIIISMTGTSGKRDYGYAVKIQCGDSVFLLNQRLGKFVPNNSIDSEFLLYILHAKYFLNKLYTRAGGTKQANLTNEQILSILICSPDLEEQKQIGSILSKQDHLIEKEQQYLQKLKSLKSGLMEDLLTGKVRVK